MKTILLLLSLALSQAICFSAQNLGTNKHGALVLRPNNPIGRTNQPPVTTNLPPAASTDLITFPWSNAPNYAVKGTPTNLVGGTIEVTWNNPLAALALLDFIELRRLDGTNLVFVGDAKIAFNAKETFTITRPGTYMLLYWTFYPREVKAVSAFIVVTGSIPVGNTFAVFGDSLAFGLGPELERRLGAPVITMGVPGESTRQSRTRLPELLAKNPNAVVMSSSFNDFLNDTEHDMTLSETFNNLEFMFKELQSRGVPVIFLGTFESVVPILSDEFRRLTSNYGVIYIPDTLSGIIGRPSLTENDLVHPNAAGYSRIIDRIEPVFPIPFTGAARLEIENAASAIKLSWFARSDTTYTVQYKPTLSASAWLFIGEVQGEGKHTEVLVFKPLNVTTRAPARTGFYRLLEN